MIKKIITSVLIAIITTYIVVNILNFLSDYDIKIEKKDHKLLSPFVSSARVSRATFAKVFDEEETVDSLVAKYAKKYANDTYSEGYLKQILHCLLYRESRYDKDKRCGDGGKSCGSMQFWQDTYNAYRKEMIKKKYVDYIGSRHDLEDAIETTAWAVSSGRGKAWGPILRGECK